MGHSRQDKGCPSPIQDFKLLIGRSATARPKG